MKRHQKSMLHGPLLPSIISYAVPIVLTGLLQLLFNAADLVVVGQFRGSASLAAVGATGSITNLVVNLFIGLSVGVGVAVGFTVADGVGVAVGFTVAVGVAVGLLVVDELSSDEESSLDEESFSLRQRPFLQ